jgi:S1-C subfamily serine protease
MVYPTERRPSALPLMVAGAALVLAVWTLVERTGWLQPGLKVEPRTVTPRGDLAEFEKVAIRIFEDNKGSVAHITTANRRVPTWLGYEQAPGGTGSGFVWDTQGLVVTNYHVVKGHERETIRVSFDGEAVFAARLLNGSETHDIAVLRLEAPPAGLRPVQLGTSSDLKVGQAVFAIGNPFGLDHTLTTGVISALDRTIRTENSTLSGVIQVDAAINPGNSGGPLFDSAGRLIGMNTAIYSPTGASAGLGFAVPVDVINNLASRLIAGASQRRQAGRPATSRIEGVVVEGPSRLGRAYRTGFAVMRIEDETGETDTTLRTWDSLSLGGGLNGDGDVIFRIDERPVTGMRQLNLYLAGKRVGDTVKLEVLRAGKLQTILWELK